MPHRALGGQVYFCESARSATTAITPVRTGTVPSARRTGQRVARQPKEPAAAGSYFMVTFTLPAELRSVARPHQKTLYNLLSEPHPRPYRNWLRSTLHRRPDRHGRRAPYLDPRSASIILTCITSSPAADSPPMAGGCPHAKTFSSTSSPCQSSSAPSSESNCKRPTCSRWWISRSGTKIGSFTRSRSAGRRPSNISPLTSFGWPSAITASSR